MKHETSMTKIKLNDTTLVHAPDITWKHADIVPPHIESEKNVKGKYLQILCFQFLGKYLKNVILKFFIFPSGVL